MRSIFDRLVRRQNAPH